MHDPHKLAHDLEELFDREEAERLAVVAWWIEHKGRLDQEDAEEFLAEVFTEEQARGIVEIAGSHFE